MKKIYETDFCGGETMDDDAEMLIIYELEGNEYLELFEEYEDDEYSFDNERLLNNLGYYSDYWPMPGTLYTRFYVEAITLCHLVIARRDTWNI